MHRTGPRSNFLSANNLLHQGPHMDAGCHKGNCLPRRGLCAIPPRFFFATLSSLILHFRREERASPPCPSRYQSGLSWQPTPPSTTASQACPSPQEGQVTWECGQWGVWEEEGPSFSSCTAPPTLEDHLANIATAPNTAVVLEVLPPNKCSSRWFCAQDQDLDCREVLNISKTNLAD